MQEEWLEVSEVCEMTGFTRSHVHRWTSELAGTPLVDKQGDNPRDRVLVRPELVTLLEARRGRAAHGLTAEEIADTVMGFCSGGKYDVAKAKVLGLLDLEEK